MCPDDAMGGPAGRVAVVLTGGDPVDPALAGWLPQGAYVIAADSGLAQAGALGLAVDLVVGDLDSVLPAMLESAAASGALVERHPAAKDHTDLELGLRAAQAWGARRVVVVGGHGGRLDHFVANVLVLAGDDFSDLSVEALVGSAHLAVVRTRLEMRGRPRQLVTLLALGGPARGVPPEGLRYQLRGEELLPGSTRGVSNEMTRPTATVSVATGTVLVVRPDATGPARPAGGRPPAAGR